MHGVQPAVPKPPSDRAAAQPGRIELRSCDQPVLSTRNPRYYEIGVLNSANARRFEGLAVFCITVMQNSAIV